MIIFYKSNKDQNITSEVDNVLTITREFKDKELIKQLESGFRSFKCIREKLFASHESYQKVNDYRPHDQNLSQTASGGKERDETDKTIRTLARATVTLDNNNGFNIKLRVNS